MTGAVKQKYGKQTRCPCHPKNTSSFSLGGEMQASLGVFEIPSKQGASYLEDGLPFSKWLVTPIYKP